MNSFSGIGRLGRDAVVRATTSGKHVVSFALAIDVGFGDNKKTVWFDCTAWGDRFTKIADFMLKGDRCGVQGEIGTREHEGKTYVTLNVREVTLLGDRREGGNERPMSQRAPARAPERSRSVTPPGDLEDDEIPF